METARKKLRGVIQGRTVVLDGDPGWPDGQPVIVIPEPTAVPEEEARMRLLRAAGGWSGDDEEEFAEYLASHRQHRKLNRPEIEE